jgi:hypothetical protein
VRLDRGLLDDEFARDLSVREAADDELEYLALARGELSKPCFVGEVGSRLLRHALHNASRHRW